MAQSHQLKGVAGKGKRRASPANNSMSLKKHPGTLETNKIYCTDARQGLKKLPDESIDCVVTSPPYWATRDYGVGKTKWPDGSESALGMEKDFTLYDEHLCLFFDEVRRVLKSTGTCWVNIGDTYAGSWAGTTAMEATENGNSAGTSWRRPAYEQYKARPPSSLPQRAKPRSLCQIPARFAIAMCERGWILRNDIVWHKPNHMPASVKNRFACSWEHLFLFVKQPKYFFDLDAVRVPHKSKGNRLFRSFRDARVRLSQQPHGDRLCPNPSERQAFHPMGKNPGDFWSISPEMRRLGDIIGFPGVTKTPYGKGWINHVPGGMAKIIRENDPQWLSPHGKNPEDVWHIVTQGSTLGHFAMFPEKLVERPILAGCPKRICKRCATPLLTRSTSEREKAASQKNAANSQVTGTKQTQIVFGCKCKRGFDPGIVLDPFMGAGTTAVVAKRLGRRFIGFELNQEYVKIANQRLATVDRAKESNSKGRDAA